MNSNLLQLETLELEFQNTLTQYQTAYANYISALNNSTSATPNYITLPGKAFWGTASISNQQEPTAIQCQALCSTNASCSGATYNSTTTNCSLRSGINTINTGLETDNAIVPELTLYISNLQMLNQTLMNINDKINSTINNIEPVAQKEQELTQQKRKELKKTYDYLMQERRNIDNMLRNNYSINQQIQNNSLQVAQSDIQYIMWTFIALISIVIVIRLQLARF